jgi:alpha-galactosidase
MKNQTTTEFPTLQSKDGTMVVSFYPVKTPFGDVSQTWTLKVLEWQGIETISKKFINKVEKKVQLREYASYEYVVTKDNSNLPQIGNPMAGAC